MKRYNVILLMTDQQRADAVGCYGNPAVETPNLDWLAAQGTKFTQAYSPSPSCVPTRAALLTGMNLWRKTYAYDGSARLERSDFDWTRFVAK